jgi:hypothetical protein
LRPIYKMNRLMRRLGLRPTPPGRSPLLDGIKAAVGNTMRQAVAPFHPNRKARSYPNWRPPHGATGRP